MTKSEKVPILGIFSPKTILMFRVGLKNRVGRPAGTIHAFHLSLINNVDHYICFCGKIIVHIIFSKPVESSNSILAAS